MKLRSTTKRKKDEAAAARKLKRSQMDQEEMNAVRRAKRNLAHENAAKKERKQKVAPDVIDKANKERRKKRHLCSKKQMVSSVDFSMKIDDNITNDSFYDFEQSPECSALLYHLNSGHHKFYQVEKLIRSDTPPEEHKQFIKELKEEIEDEILSEEEMCKLMDEFCVAQG